MATAKKTKRVDEAEAAGAEAAECVVRNDLGRVPPDNGQLVTIVDKSRPLAPIPSYPLPMPDGRTERLLTSFDPTDPEHAAKVFDCINSEDFKGDWAKENVLEVEHVLIHPTEYTDEDTGEVRQGSRCVLVTTDGTRIALHSNGVIKAILLACSFFGRPPWKPARKFRVKEIPTGKKRRFYTLEIAR